MDSYLIIKANEKTEYEKYSYLLDKFSIPFVIWTNEDESDIVDKLYELVRPYSIWKLFIADLSKVIDAENPFCDNALNEVQTLMQETFFTLGRNTCRPPEKIYILARRNKKSLSGIKGSELEGIQGAIPACRFLVMDYPSKSYLKIYEDLKLISLVIIMAVNDMPPEVMEAYVVYLVEVEISDYKLQHFLKMEKDILEDEKWEIEREKQELEDWKGEGYYKESNVQLPGSTFKTMQIENSSLGIKNFSTQKMWQKEKVNIAVRLKQVQSEQLTKQSELKLEFKKRINELSTEDMFLKNDELESIQESIRQLQQELNQSFIKLWEIEKELMGEEHEKEKEVNEIHQNLYSWREILLSALLIWGFILIVFLFFLAEEQKIWGELGDLTEDFDSKMNWIKECIKCVGIYFMLPPIMFVVMIPCLDTLELFKKKLELNHVLRKIEARLKTNISHYKDFYMRVYNLNIKENYLTKNQNYLRHKNQKRELIIKKEDKWNSKNRKFNVLSSLFTYLLKDTGNGEQKVYSKEKVLLLNAREDRLYSPLYFVEGLFIIKEVEDDY